MELFVSNHDLRNPRKALGFFLIFPLYYAQFSRLDLPCGKCSWLPPHFIRQHSRLEKPSVSSLELAFKMWQMLLIFPLYYGQHSRSEKPSVSSLENYFRFSAVYLVLSLSVLKIIITGSCASERYWAHHPFLLLIRSGLNCFFCANAFIL